MTEWKPDPARRGAFGIEFHGWSGIERGSDLFHRYVVIGLVTLYTTTTPLYRFLKMMRRAREAMKEGR